MARLKRNPQTDTFEDVQEVGDAEPPQDSPVLLDLGEADFEPMIDTTLAGEFYMPSYVGEIVPKSVRWKQVEGEAKRGREISTKSALFIMNGKGYSVGENAASNSTFRQITGAQKYQAGVIDAMIMAALVRALPDGHKRVILAPAYVAGDQNTAYADIIQELMMGKHQISFFNGKTIEYNIVGFSPYEEPAGGAVRFMTKPYADYNAADLKPGTKVLILDIGGKISSIFPATIGKGMKMDIHWEDGDAIDLGIQDVINEIWNALKMLDPQRFNSDNPIAEQMVQCIRNRGWFMDYDQVYDGRDAYQMGTEVFFNMLKIAWAKVAKKVRTARIVICTGGGTGAFFDVLPSIIGFKNLFAADDLGGIRFANMRGGVHALKVWAKINNAAKHNRTAYVVIDAGNSEIKAWVMVGDRLVEVD